MLRGVYPDFDRRTQRVNHRIRRDRVFSFVGARKIKNSLGGEQESVDQAPKLKGTRVLARELKKGPRWLAGEYSTHLAA